MDWPEHITSDPDILLGKPIIKGTHISVEMLLECFADGWSYDDILAAYPALTQEQVQAAMVFVTEVFKRQSFGAAKAPAG